MMSKALEVIRRLLVAVFGRWEPPAWAGAVGRGARSGGRWARAHKGRTLFFALGLAALGASGYRGWHWWQSRPKPVETHVTVTAPDATRLEDKPRINPLTVDFDRSVAPLSNAGKVVTSGVELDPKLEGTWKWESDRQLTFTPKADWPIGQELTVKLAKRGLLAEHIRLDEYRLSVSTPAFEARLVESEFYQDPVDPNLKKVVATFRFTHAVDAAEFEKRLALRLIPSNREEREADYRFHVSYDRWKGNAYVHSEPVAVPQKDAVMRITLDQGARAQRGGPAFDQKLEDKVTIPGLYNFLKIGSAQLAVVDNERNEPEQVLVLESSAGVSESEMRKHVQAWVLPRYADKDEEQKKRPHDWGAAELVGDSDLAHGQRLELEPVASEKEYATLHSFKLKAEVGRSLYVRVHKGLRAFGGYVLGDTFQATMKVEPFPRQLRILHSGSLLSLSGEKKVSVFARDVPAIQVEIGRILPEQLHHLVTQGVSNGNYGHPSFTYSFDAYNLAEVFTEERKLDGAQPGKPAYEAIDLSRYLLGAGGRGVFLLKVRSWDPQAGRALGEEDQRLVLVSDLGLLVKDNADDSHEAFVQSIATGQPVAGARVEVLGKNGQPTESVTTDADGHAHLASFEDLRREHAPAVYVASKGRDSSFLPIRRSDRYLDTSRFEVGGVTEAADPRSLQAYVFSDRGIYRPGDEMRFGFIVRSRDWQKELSGVPLQVTITDARGLLVRKEAIKLSASGFEELRHTTPEVAPTGNYTISVHTVKDGRPANLLGSTTVRVRELMPDKMKIAVHLSTENPEGWVDPKGLRGRVHLENLFGTPAAGRKVKGTIHLTPALPSFARLKDYRFFDAQKRDSVSDQLSDVTTGDDGSAEVDLGLQRFTAATYRLTFLAEGLESEGGRGVVGEAVGYVSPLPWLLGYKPDGDLRWLPKGSSHELDLVAVGPRGERVDVKGLKAVLYEKKYVSVLTRQDNGTYKYESVARELPVADKPLAVSARGTKYALPTGKPGTWIVLVKNERDEDVQRIEYTVAGAANLQRAMDKNAELEVQLKQRDVEPGDELELAIKAPYVGAGLITIERDRVYSWKWFRSDTTATVQRIRLPEGLEGDGYVSVSFLRDPGSDEVFSSPLSFGVQPFSISRAHRAAQITLESAELAKPGEPYQIRYATDRPTRLALFAVDEGILRVASYETPDPLAFFFRKRALQVRTTQILDLVLPEWKKLMAALAPGGDDEAALAAHLNPFKRRTEKPVAFWSGIVDAGPKEKELSFDLPDSFNGTLRVMAIAVAPEAIGRAEKRALVRGDFVISPSVPLTVAPGDEFEVSVGVANNVAGSGKGAAIALALETTKGLEVIGPAKQSLAIDELREGTARFKLKATSQLGSATLTFRASGAGPGATKTGRLATDVSVRPASPYLVTFQAGHLRAGSQKVPVPRQLYSEHRELQAGISHLPLGLTHGLAGYLEKYPHGCTEQVVSQAVPAIVLSSHADFGVSQASAAESVQRAIAILRTRQNEEGGFGLWAANPQVHPLASIYALHVLTEAKDRGFAVPGDLLQNGMGWLQSVARADGDSLAEERNRAYAIYVLTRNGMVTSGFLQALEKHLAANYPKQWRQDLTGAYVAASYRLLEQDKLARALLAEQKLGGPIADDYAFYYDALAHDAQLLYLFAKHFPERAARVTPEELDAMVQPIFRGTYNTFSSAQTILALASFGETAGQRGAAAPGKLSIRELLPKGAHALELGSGLLPVARFAPEASALEFAAEGDFGSYWLVGQRGFDLELPSKPIASKIEVFREYTDGQKAVSQVKLGDQLEVHLRVRALGAPVDDLAIVDLLPGGFEVVLQEPPRDQPSDPAEGADVPARNEGEDDGEGEGEGEGEAPEHHVGERAAAPFALPVALPGSTFELEYGDVREDRVVLFGSAGSDVKELVYAIKATNVGKYVTPPVQAEAMYDRSVVARGTAGHLEVVPR